MKPLFALDLEMNQPNGEIIQAGTCVFDLDAGTVIDSQLYYVYTDVPITPFITELTGITQEQNDTLGQPLDAVVSDMLHNKSMHGCFMNPLVWGHGDVALIKKSIGSNLLANDFQNSMGRRIIDAKTIYVAWRMAQGKPPMGGLGKAMTHLGMQFEGRKHNAMSDAINTARIYHKMVGLLK